MAFRNVLSCYICDRVSQPRLMIRIDGDDKAVQREIAISRRDIADRLPLEVTDQVRICNNCNRSILNEIRDLERDPQCLRLNILKQSTSNTCLICNARINIHRLSVECRVDVFVNSNIYIPEYVKSCTNHLNAQGLLLRFLLAGLQFTNRPYVIKGPQLLMFLQQLRALAVNNSRFEDEHSFSDDEFKIMTSLTKDQFSELFTFCDPVPVQNHVRYVKKKDLLTFLCKVRQGLSDEFLKVIFDYRSRQTVSLAIALVRQSLMLRFVPHNIGFAAITRQEYIERHVTEFANVLYNSEPNNPKVIAYIDGTYAYIQRSRNFQVLRQSFCFYKGNHLVKPVLIVAPDGYILDIQGPYFSDSRNNDAEILRSEFERDVGGMTEWFHNNDIVIVDRGYRDAKELLERLGIAFHMPELLQRGQSQFSTEEANASRLVTKTRWIVEARNGHIKSIFKFFSQIIIMPHVSNIGDFYKIAGALINRYHDSVLMEGANAQLAQTMLEKAQQVNILQALVEEQNLQRRNGQWINLDNNHIADFPRLPLEYVRDLTVGIYQVNLAPSYIQDTLQRDDTEVLQLDLLRNEPGIIRIRIYSRFRNAAKHQLWIAYRINNGAENEVDEGDPILGHYCTCKSGARTLGTCAHIASVVWFLGYARHEQHVKYPSSLLLNAILDAGGRQQQHINDNVPNVV